ncbi:hypothetical protein [Algirhabdus cladophorae]|uniref:hypothetical protein n=1 Tax=Algirhabdus cladophorae TaxID=3377108 RepID=UPI003B845B31
MTVSKFPAGASAVGVALTLVKPVQAATCTYDIDHTFGLMRDSLLGVYAKPPGGLGGLALLRCRRA